MLRFAKKGRYNHILESVFQGTGIATELPLLLPILKRIPTPTFEEMFHSDRLLREYADIAVRNSKEMGSKANIFAAIINEAEKGGHEQLTDLDVQLEAGNFIVAGSDTTRITLTYLVWAILKRPELQHTVEDEVAPLSDNLTDAELEELPLLNACIEGTLRLYGAAPGGLPRTVPAGGATLGGYYIPEGITVTTQGWSLHRDPNNFPDPDQYFSISNFMASR